MFKIQRITALQDNTPPRHFNYPIKKYVYLKSETEKDLGRIRMKDEIN